MTRQKSFKPALRSLLLLAAVLLGGTSPALAGVTVSLTAPANNATFLAPANISLSATASANQGYTLSKVEFFHGTTLIGTDTSSPYSINWSNVPAASFSLTAKATAIKKNSADQTATSTPVNIIVNAPNVPPSVSLTSPAGGATFNAPASITLTANASDSDGTITKVEFFHGGTNLIATVTTPPYSVLWSSVPQAAYTLTAVATDNQLATTTSSPVNVSVGPPVPQMYFIHTDHLNTPRLVADASGATVWLWEQQEPFGTNWANENPGGAGIFDLPLRYPGQYFDKETTIHYNYSRDYDPALGRYIESDPIGLAAGLNTYGYVVGNPIGLVDPYGDVSRAPGPKMPDLSLLGDEINPSGPDSRGNSTSVCQIMFELCENDGYTTTVWSPTKICTYWCPSGRELRPLVIPKLLNCPRYYPKF